MKFKSMTIDNFRNFKSITVDLDNRNIFFGMNDVGKTNFLQAIRYVLDNRVRRNNMQESDYHCKDTRKIIKMCIEIDLSDDDDYSKIIRARAKGAIYSNTNDFYIQLYTEPYDKTEQIGFIGMKWGSDLDDLDDIGRSASKLSLDSIFNIIYIDVYEDMHRMFQKHRDYIFSGLGDINDSSTDEEIYNTIKAHKKELENSIHRLSKVNSFEDDITKEFNSIKDIGVSVKLQSEINVGDFYGSLTPYMQNVDDNNIYPISGEGRRKILIYMMYKLLCKAKEYSYKINIFLIEEPENNLHVSMQIALSNLLFSNDIAYKYLFMSTHSSYMMTYMDNVNLIRVYNDSNEIVGKSYLYAVDSDYKENKNQYNRELAEALFVRRVLLVEGPSEVLLFNKVLSNIDPNYELSGILIMNINGIYFSSYKKILAALKIKNYIKTDNDLQKVKTKKEEYILASGLNRCNKIIENCTSENILFSNIKYYDQKKDNKLREKIYQENEKNITVLQDDYRIYLSKIDLETDLSNVITLSKYETGEGGKFSIRYLKEHKWRNMSYLVKRISKDDCEKIYNSPVFRCLKDVYEGR